MKCGCWQKMSVIVLAAATCQGCSCSTMPQLMKQDVESVVFEHHQDNGLQLEAKWADLSQDEQTVLYHWMSNSPLRGTGGRPCNICADGCGEGKEVQPQFHRQSCGLQL